jgi:hypothetical protein
MITYILIGVATVIVLFLVIVALQSGAFRITRKTLIKGPAEAPFARVNDFRQWRSWSPWETMDPNLQRTYAGPPFGVGATYSWEGDKKVGSGRMTILESRPHDLVRIKLEFLKPFVATNLAEFTFQPQGGSTEVSWTMTGDRNFCFKCIGMFMSMDKMVGGAFEEGLANMKAAVENPSSTPAPAAV